MAAWRAPAAWRTSDLDSEAAAAAAPKTEDEQRLDAARRRLPASPRDSSVDAEASAGDARVPQASAEELAGEASELMLPIVVGAEVGRIDLWRRDLDCGDHPHELVCRDSRPCRLCAGSFVAQQRRSRLGPVSRVNHFSATGSKVLSPGFGIGGQGHPWGWCAVLISPAEAMSRGCGSRQTQSREQGSSLERTSEARRSGVDRDCLDRDSAGDDHASIRNRRVRRAPARSHTARARAAVAPAEPGAGAG